MLVIHWARHNLTSRILKNGIRPSFRRGSEGRRNPKGVYVYPFSRSSTLSGNWRRNLKVWDGRLGNCNGFVFRLDSEDFPVKAGYWFFNRSDPDQAIIQTLDELAGLYGEFFSAEILNMRDQGVPYNWNDFEIIIPHKIDPSRLLKVLKDRPPKKPIERTA
jgi:hypothetical protein